MTQGIKILYVDDELNNLNSFQAALRYEYHVLTAASANDALAMLHRYPDINIIFCDQRMPGKTGVEFFQEVRTSFPSAVRILITGYSDMEAIIDAINKGNVLRYLTKPWTKDDIVAAIEEAHKFYLTNSLLAAKNEELQKAYTTLDEFSYQVTHGLREPLLSVLGIVEVAQAMAHVPDDLKEILRLVSGSMLQLDNFIAQAHDHHRLKKELLTTDISFEHLIADIVHPYSILARNAQVRFTYNIQQQAHFYSDETCLRVIFTNLLSNAFRALQPEEKHSVELSLLVSDGKAVATIIDSGNKRVEPELLSSVNEADGTYQNGFSLNSRNVSEALAKLKAELQVTTLDDGSSKVVVQIPQSKSE